MWRILLVVIGTAVGGADSAPASAPQGSSDGPDYFADCREGDTIPSKLKETYAAFVSSAPQGKVERFCLPHSVTIRTAVRPKDREDIGDMNLPFLKRGFSNAVFSARKESEDCYLLRTGSSALWFVETKSGEWRIYQYFDKPIQ